MSKPTDELIWVTGIGGVRGYTPEEIVAFEEEYKKLQQFNGEYWSFFDWYFNNAKETSIAYSSLWHFDKAWAKLNYLRKQNARKTRLTNSVQ